VFTAAASVSGFLACFNIFSNFEKSFLRKSLMSFVPFLVLHFSQLKVRFIIELLPPLARG
jgi:hypothetical protein